MIELYSNINNLLSDNELTVLLDELEKMNAFIEVTSEAVIGYDNMQISIPNSNKYIIITNIPITTHHSKYKVIVLKSEDWFNEQKI